MEDVELFLAALTARSKIREVIRGLVATRQVHTISLGHAPHFYVAGTLPEFEPVSAIYASAGMSPSSYFLRSFDRDDEAPKPAVSVYSHAPAVQQPVVRQPALQPTAQIPAAPAPVRAPEPMAPEQHAPRTPVRRSSNGNGNFNRAASNGHERNGHDHKSARPNRPAAASNGHSAHRNGESRKARPQKSAHSANSRWGTKNGNSKHSNGHASNGSRTSKTARVSSTNGSHRTAKPSGPTWSKRTSTTKAKPAASRKGGAAHKNRPTLAAAGRASGTGKRFFSNRTKSRTGNGNGQGTKKRG